jgi:RNA polymerase sigma-70 factor, ECF subfamily
MEPCNSLSCSKINPNQNSPIITGVIQGDVSAFKAFFYSMQPGIYKFLLRYLSDPDAAKDLTQDTFIKFWIHRQQIDPSQSPKSYLYKIARNLAYNYATRNHSSTRISHKKIELISALINPEEEYDKHFFLDDFQNAVDELPERCRATFILCKYEGFDYSEIAGILDVSLQTVKNQMNKAISVLKKLLSSYLY